MCGTLGNFSAGISLCVFYLRMGQSLPEAGTRQNCRPASPRNALISVLPELKYQHTSLNPILQKATACTHVCIYACVYLGCGDRVHCMADMWRSEDNLQ